MENNRELSKSELESHTRIFEQIIDSDKIETTFETGIFETPALILNFNSMPTKQYLNMLYNSLDVENVEVKQPNDNKMYLYFYMNKDVKEPVCIILGLIEKTLDNLYRLEEMVKRFNVQVYECEDENSFKPLNYLDYITNMTI